MADILKTEGLVITATYSNQVYPFACAKNSSINITRDFIELAPKTNGNFKEYLKGRSSFTVSGTGLIKLAETNMHAWYIFDQFILAQDAMFKCYLDMIDNQNNYHVYKFDCYFKDLTVDSNIDAIPSYSFSLQGTGPIELINIVDTRTVSSAKITGLDTSTYKLVAVGYGGKWYFNYSVTEPSVGVFEILMPGVANGTIVKAAYLSL